MSDRAEIQGPRDRAGWVYGGLTVTQDTGRRYRGEVIWECLSSSGELIYKRSSRLTKFGKRVEGWVE